MKGMIADISGKKAVLLAENGEFITVPNKGYFSGQIIEYRPHSYKQPALYAASLAASVVLCIGGYGVYHTPVSSIDMDINPSIRIEINILDKVIDIVPLNDDADKLLSVCNRKSGAIEECIDEIISLSKEMGYLNGTNNNIEMDVMSSHKKPHEAANSYVSKTDIDGLSINTAVYTAQKSELEKAKELSISVGRLKAIEGFSEEYGGKTEKNAKKLENVATKEIKRRTEETKSGEVGGFVGQSENNRLIASAKDEKTSQNTRKSSGTIKTEPVANYSVGINTTKTKNTSVKLSDGIGKASTNVVVSRPEFTELPMNNNKSGSEYENSENNSGGINSEAENEMLTSAENSPMSEIKTDGVNIQPEGRPIKEEAAQKPVIPLPEFDNKDNWQEDKFREEDAAENNSKNNAEDKKDNKTEETDKNDKENKKPEVNEPANEVNNSLKSEEKSESNKENSHIKEENPSKEAIGEDNNASLDNMENNLGSNSLNKPNENNSNVGRPKENGNDNKPEAPGDNHEYDKNSNSQSSGALSGDGQDKANSAPSTEHSDKGKNNSSQSSGALSGDGQDKANSAPNTEHSDKGKNNSSQSSPALGGDGQDKANSAPSAEHSDKGKNSSSQSSPTLSGNGQDKTNSAPSTEHSDKGKNNTPSGGGRADSGNNNNSANNGDRGAVGGDGGNFGKGKDRG